MTADIEKLKQRVAKIEIKVDVEGAQVRVDDDVVGTTPLAAPVVVSVGRHRVGATQEGRVAALRVIEVVGGDVTTLSLELPPVPATKSVAVAPLGDPSGAAPPPAGPSHVPMWIGWTTTGLLIAGAVTTGVLSLSGKSDLDTALAARPGSATAIDSARSRAKTFAVTTDVLGGAAIVAAGISTYLTVKAYSHDSKKGGATPSWSVAIAPNGAFATGTF